MAPRQPAFAAVEAVRRLAHQLELWVPPPPALEALAVAIAPAHELLEELRAEAREARHDARWWRSEGKRLAEAALEHLERPSERTAEMLRVCAQVMRRRRDRTEIDADSALGTMED